MEEMKVRMTVSPKWQGKTRVCDCSNVYSHFNIKVENWRYVHLYIWISCVVRMLQGYRTHENTSATALTLSRVTIPEKLPAHRCANV